MVAPFSIAPDDYFVVELASGVTAAQVHATTAARVLETADADATALRSVAMAGGIGTRYTCESG